jgi:hypothetical protein
MTVEERVKQQFPGMFTTLVSVLVGLVLADLVSQANDRMALWPLSPGVLRTWAQVLAVAVLAVTVWIFFSHLGIARQRVASLLDTFIAFLTPALLLIATSLAGRAESWPFFYCAGGFGVAALVLSLWLRYVVSKDPDLASFRVLLRPTGYFGQLCTSTPLALLVGWVDQQGWLSTPAQTFFTAIGIPGAIFTMHLFVRDWRRAISAASVESDRAALAQGA